MIDLCYLSPLAKSRCLSRTLNLYLYLFSAFCIDHIFTIRNFRHSFFLFLCLCCLTSHDVPHHQIVRHQWSLLFISQCGELKIRRVYVYALQQIADFHFGAQTFRQHFTPLSSFTISSSCLSNNFILIELKSSSHSSSHTSSFSSSGFNEHSLLGQEDLDRDIATNPIPNYDDNKNDAFSSSNRSSNASSFLASVEKESYAVAYLQRPFSSIKQSSKVETSDSSADSDIESECNYYLIVTIDILNFIFLVPSFYSIILSSLFSLFCPSSSVFVCVAICFVPFL